MRYILILILCLAAPAVAQDARWSKLNACGANVGALLGLTYRQVVDRCGSFNTTRRSTRGETIILGYPSDPRRLYVYLVDDRVVDASY